MGAGEDLRERRAVRLVFLAFPIVGLAAAAMLLLGPEPAALYADLGVTGAATAAAVLAWAFVFTQRTDSARLTGSLIATGLASFAIAEMFWAYYDITSPEADLSLSPADGFWLFAYAPLILAGAVTVRRFAEYVGIRTALATLTAWMAGFPTLLFPYLLLIWDPSADIATALVVVAYPVLDYCLLLVLALLLLSYRGGRMAGYWLVLVVATLVLTAADFAYGLRQSSGEYYTGDLADSLYLFAYGVYGLLFAALLALRVHYASSEPAGRYEVKESFVLSPAGNVVSNARADGWKGSADPEVVGAMAGIVRGFAGAAFRDAKAKPLDQISFGELRLCYEGGHHGYVVVVAVKGSPTEELKGRMRDALAALPERIEEDRPSPEVDRVARSLLDI